VGCHHAKVALSSTYSAWPPLHETWATSLATSLTQTGLEHGGKYSSKDLHPLQLPANLTSMLTPILFIQTSFLVVRCAHIN